MFREISKKTLVFYEDKKGHFPFIKWLESLDRTSQARVRHRLTKLEMGHYGDHKNIGEGILELRLFFGSGYRIYFGEMDNTIVLMGGDKKSQTKDIQKAKLYWRNYKEALH